MGCELEHWSKLHSFLWSLGRKKIQGIWQNECMYSTQSATKPSKLWVIFHVQEAISSLTESCRLQQNLLFCWHCTQQVLLLLNLNSSKSRDSAEHTSLQRCGSIMFTGGLYATWMWGFSQRENNNMWSCWLVSGLLTLVFSFLCAAMVWKGVEG